MDTRTRKRRTSKIYKETVDNMKDLGTFQAQFEASVRRYAELRIQYDILLDQWYEDGCKITEIYTNKSGAENERKTALYLSLEMLRKELIEMENIFGLTPKGLKAIKSKGLDLKKESAIDAALRKMDG